ncbi:MAG: serine/threonine protein kinase [Blastocatellales bacterium]
MGHELSRKYCRPKTNQIFTVGKEEYRLGGELGDGAVGLVRKAMRVKDGAPRAIKFLAPDSKYIDEAVFDDVAARFKREGERGAQLRHTHLITIYAYCENKDGVCFETREPKNPFLLMEHIQGKTLESFIKKVVEEERKVFFINRQRLHIAIQIVAALEDLHRKKLIHRDIKPANIFLSRWADDEGHLLTKLGDFGVMKWGDFQASMSTGTLTVTSQKGLGTMKYMSPELAISPKDITVRSDIYSLGITLFELFSGQILLSAHHVYEIMNARLSRGTTASRYYTMGYNLRGEDEGVADLLLDMFLRGVTGRPSIEKIRGRLESEYERRYDTNWEADLP